MSEESYEEENLDVFMLKAAEIFSQPSSKEKADLLESLKQHLSSIFDNKGEMENFFKTLSSVIFSQDLKLINKQVFILYPVIYSFNPKLLTNYFYFFLDSLQLCLTDKNKNEFTFLSKIFSDVVQSFFNEKNENIIKKNYLLDKKGKNFLFEKIMDFCEENIRTNKRLEQSFGCLILTEFIEKCPLIKDPNYLDIIFKKISDYLDDRWFECKLDLLNCTISLIFSAENKFRPYANICLFKVMDYLTDTDWMMRKLAINIVYTLVFYCKDEILAVKENIIEFINALKEDEKEEIREVCKQILDFILNDSDNKTKEKRSIEINSQSNKSNKSKKTKKTRNENVSQEKKKKNNSTNTSNNTNSNSKNNSAKNAKNKNVDIIPIKNKENKEDNNSNINNTNDIKELDDKINLIINEIKKISDEQEKFRIKLENLIQKEEDNYNNLNERFILIEKKNMLKKRNKKGNNNLFTNNSYNSSGGIKINNRSVNYSKEKRTIKPKMYLSKQYEEKKINKLKNDFQNGNYNEALIESKQNDKYLLELLPLMIKEIIPKIEIAILEDSISRLNKRIYILYMDGEFNYINDILEFYEQLINAKKKLKLVTKLRIKEAMNFLKSKGNNFFEENDMNKIDNIIDMMAKA